MGTEPHRTPTGLAAPSRSTTTASLSCSYVKAGFVFSGLKMARTRSRLRQRMASRRLLAFGALAFEVGARRRVDAGLADRDPVEGGVELAVAAAVEPVALYAA